MFTSKTSQMKHQRYNPLRQQELLLADYQLSSTFEVNHTLIARTLSHKEFYSHSLNVCNSTDATIIGQTMLRISNLPFI